MNTKEIISPLFKWKCQQCIFIFFGVFLFFNFFSQNVFAGSVVETETLSWTGYRYQPATIETSELSWTGYRFQPATIETSELSWTGYRSRKPKFNKFNFKLPFTTDALQMTGVKSKKTKFPFDSSNIDEDMFAPFDEREASPKGRQGRQQRRQQRRQQTGVVRTNESIVPQFIPTTDYDTEIR